MSSHPELSNVSMYVHLSNRPVVSTRLIPTSIVCIAMFFFLVHRRRLTSAALPCPETKMGQEAHYFSSSTRRTSNPLKTGHACLFMRIKTSQHHHPPFNYYTSSLGYTFQSARLLTHVHNTTGTTTLSLPPVSTASVRLAMEAQNPALDIVVPMLSGSVEEGQPPTRSQA